MNQGWITEQRYVEKNEAVLASFPLLTTDIKLWFSEIKLDHQNVVFSPNVSIVAEVKSSDNLKQRFFLCECFHSVTQSRWSLCRNASYLAILTHVTHECVL